MNAKKLLFAMAGSALALLSVVARAEQVSFPPSDADFPNPERGLFHHLEYHTGDQNRLTASYLQKAREEENMSLMFTVYVLEDFRDGSMISEDYLNRIRENMQTLRNEGFKCVLRFCYSYGENDYPRDIPWNVCSEHIEQLRPILREYADVIAVLEAGFIGAWGEWYYTDNYIMNPSYNDYAPRRILLEKLLYVMPQSRCVSVRYPAAKLGIYQTSPNQALTPQTAHDGSDISRTGFHNDCFLGDADDVGTFGNNQHYRQYWKTESRYLPMGGETCTYPNAFTGVDNALENFSDYHWSYLNVDYHPGTISEWRSNKFLNTVSLSLGYRFRLVKATYDKEVTAGDPCNLTVDINNIGWAAPYNPRNVEIVLTDAEGAVVGTQTINADPRNWFAGETQSIDATFTVPASLPTGAYTVWLSLPDPEATLHDDPRYSIRMANQAVWNAERGMNRLCTISVTANASITATTDKRDQLCDVYSISGTQLLGDALYCDVRALLRPGIYIVRQGNKSEKLIIE